MTAARRKRKSGVLRRMRAAPGKRPGPRSAPRRLLAWVGGALGLVVLGVVLYGMASFMFSPSEDKMKREVEVSIVHIEPRPEGADEAVAATAEILLEGRSVYLELDEQQAATLSVNDPLRVRYRRTVFTNAVAVDGWEPVPLSDRSAP